MEFATDTECIKITTIMNSTNNVPKMEQRVSIKEISTGEEKVINTPQHHHNVEQQVHGDGLTVCLPDVNVQIISTTKQEDPKTPLPAGRTDGMSTGTPRVNWDSLLGISSGPEISLEKLDIDFDIFDRVFEKAMEREQFRQQQMPLHRWLSETGPWCHLRA